MTIFLAAINLAASAVCAAMFADTSEPRYIGVAVFCFGTSIIVSRPEVNS